MLRLALLYQNLKFYCSWGKLNVKVNICSQKSFTQLRRKLQVDLRDKQTHKNGLHTIEKTNFTNKSLKKWSVYRLH